MRQLLILADDLSGAADCASASIGSGLSAVVTFDEIDTERPCDVLSVDCDSRHLEPGEASERVAHFMRAYKGGSSASLLFKKIDSSLRGNVAAELASALAEQRKAAGASERIVAVMAPAFPFAGRTTVDGRQLLQGRPVHETDMWAGNRVSSSSHLPSLLAEAGLRPASLDLSRIRSGRDSLRRSMLESAAIADVLVCDAETDEDLHAIASASLSLGQKTVWVGSAGLARYLSLAAELVPNVVRAKIPGLCDGPALFVIGSMSSVSEIQASRLAQHPAMTAIDVPTRTLLGGSHSLDWPRIASETRNSLERGRHTLLRVNGTDPIDPKQCRLLTDSLGLMLASYRTIAGALVATGGETARAVLAAWGITSLQVLGEVETGLPYSIANFGELALPVLTKAGSFGTPDTLLHCLEFLDNLEKGAGQMEGCEHNL